MDENQDYQKVLDDYAKATLVDVNPTPTPAPVPEPVVPPVTLPAEALASPTGGLAAASPVPPPVPVKTNTGFDIFKYAFFLSLIIFLGVVATLGYNLYKQYFSNSPVATPSPTTSESPTPSVVATPTSTAVCQLNDKSYHINETFPAADGCNTCTCGDDLTISCTEIDCSSSSVSIPADWKTYKSNEHGFTFNYPKQLKINETDSYANMPGKWGLSLLDNDVIYLSVTEHNQSGYFDEVTKTKLIYGNNTYNYFNEPGLQDGSYIYDLDKKIQISASKKDQHLNNQQFTQILSTFKFL